MACKHGVPPVGDALAVLDSTSCSPGLRLSRRRELMAVDDCVPSDKDWARASSICLAIRNRESPTIRIQSTIRNPQSAIRSSRSQSRRAVSTPRPYRLIVCARQAACKGIPAQSCGRALRSEGLPPSITAIRAWGYEIAGLTRREDGLPDRRWFYVLVGDGSYLDDGRRIVTRVSRSA